MELYIDSIPVNAAPGESLLTLVKRLGLDTDSLLSRPLAADIGGEMFTLNYVPCRETDMLPDAMGYRERKAIKKGGRDIGLVRFEERRGQRVYERTLLFVFCLAVRNLFPGAKVKTNYTVGSAISIRVEKTPAFSEADCDSLRHEFSALVKEDFTLNRKRLDVDEAIAFFEKDCQNDKADLLSWRQFSYFDIYEKDGYRDYFYGELAPSSGYLSEYDIVYTPGGVYLVRPDGSDGKAEKAYKPYANFSKVFRESDRWGSLMNCETVSDLNTLVKNGNIRELIRVNEALHERKFAELASEINSRGAKAVFIAGPSSSGKTTSANRLCTQLRVLGKKPTLISLDDYYKDRDKVPLEPDGSIDLEHIRTIDTERFAEDLSALLSGKEVELPCFDFVAQKSRPSGRFVRSSEDAPILIEGIHGLNPALLPAGFDTARIFKLYVSALTTLNLDNHNRIPTTSMRLLRRLVRDYHTRGSSVERTLGMWDSVLRGEKRWIFPFQEEADAIFNTTLVYELAVLKRHIFPILQAVPPESPCYDEVRGIIKFLNYVSDCDAEDEIPPTSILREMIGGNTFYR